MQFITSPDHAASYLKSKINYDVEELWCIALASNKRIKKAGCLFRGTVDECLVHPREIFHFAIKNRASDIIIAHSHPSGDPSPSDADLIFTRKLQMASCFFEITVLDHLILSKRKHSSLLGLGFMESQTKINEELKTLFQWPDLGSLS